ncbi:MAG: lipoyl(octanoyl) transferase LipB [Planctomycetota bacterium]|jgi:lipoyl(octanoyl) transferase
MAETTPALDLRVRDLGRMPYAEAFGLQKRLQREVIEARRPGGGPMHLLLVEHDPPVITVSRRRGARTHLVASAGQLAAAGVEVAETDRGGDITYHGPGQLVCYPIIDLNALGLRLHGYMRFLEQVVIDVLAGFGVAGSRDPEATGVWVDRDGTARKICAMGVRVSRWVSMHGLALNVTTDLGHFDLIVPCGLAGRSVTSLQRELGAAGPSLDEVKRAMVERMTTGAAGLTGSA